MHIPPDLPPPPPPTPPQFSGQVSGGAEPGLPLRTGKPRNFWSILGLSIITCSIYYIVYHYLVAFELKRALRWGENESYKPGTYVWLYTAFVVYWIIIMAVSFITIFYITLESGPEGVAKLTTGPFRFVSLAFDLLLAGVGFYITYYFLKLSDNAATKAGAPGKGVSRPVIIYSFVFGISVLISLVGLATDGDGGALGGLDAGSALSGKMLALMGFMMFLLAVYFGTAIYFLWEQTELVNHVWERGGFAEPPGYAPAPNYPLSQTPAPPPFQPRGPLPPTAPPSGEPTPPPSSPPQTPTAPKAPGTPPIPPAPPVPPAE
ncbi:MAG: hypothetical protein ACE5GA_00255 [Candidatus Zixiibacteriota bacterium]